MAPGKLQGSGIASANRLERPQAFQIALLGLVATSLVVVGSLQVQSPFALKQPCAWFYGVPHAACSRLSVPLGPPSQLYFLAITGVYSGLFIYMRVWIWLVRALSRSPGSSLAIPWLCFIAWSLPLFFAPPLFSRDAYSYAGQGEMVARGINPYFHGMAVLGPISSNPYINQVDPLWENSPNPYGALDLLVAGVLTDISGHHELVNVVLLRLVFGFGGTLVAGLFLPYLARAVHRDPAETFALAICNPIVIFHFVAGIHNDGLMTGLLIAGLALATNGMPALGVALIASSGQVKASTLVVLPFLAFWLAGPGACLSEKVSSAVKVGAVALLAMDVIAAGSGLGWGWVKNLGTPASVKSWLAPATGLGILSAKVASGTGLLPALGIDRYIAIWRGVGLVAGAALALWLLFRVDRLGMLDAAGLAGVASVVTAPVVQPWYLGWCMVVLAATPRLWVRRGVMVLSIVSTFLTLPGGRGLLHELLTAPRLLVIPYMAFLAGLLVAPSFPALKRWASHALSGVGWVGKASLARVPRRVQRRG